MEFNKGSAFHDTIDASVCCYVADKNKNFTGFVTRPVSLSSEGLTSSIHCHADALLSNFASSILHSKRMSRIKNQFL